MSIHDGPHVPLSGRAKRLRDDLRHPAPCLGGDGCSCGLALDLLIIEHDARESVAAINALGAAWAEAVAAASALFGGPTYIAMAGPEEWRGAPTYRAECGVDFAVRGEPTPAAALRALAEQLRERVG